MINHIQTGRVYRATTPRETNGMVNDRVVLRILKNKTVIQYDGPAVANGRRRPTVQVAVFMKWAERDVTDELPIGQWQSWPPPAPVIEMRSAVKDVVLPVEVS